MQWHLAHPSSNTDKLNFVVFLVSLLPSRLARPNHNVYLQNNIYGIIHQVSCLIGHLASSIFCSLCLMIVFGCLWGHHTWTRVLAKSFGSFYWVVHHIIALENQLNILSYVLISLFSFIPAPVHIADSYITSCENFLCPVRYQQDFTQSGQTPINQYADDCEFYCHHFNPVPVVLD